MNALQTIQQKLKAPKSQFNKFGNYHYRNCEDILEAVKPLLQETNSTLTITDDVVELGGSLFVKATATLKENNADHMKGWSVTAYAMHAKEQKGMNEAQITGAASSYARKYALNGLFLIDDTKDADATNTGTKDKKPEAPKSPETPNPQNTLEKEKEWLNPNTPNWESIKTRMKDGMKIEEVKKFFKLSKANETKLLNEK